MKNLFLIASLFFIISCDKDCSEEGNCTLMPDAGLCEAAFPKFYFDQDEGKCKQFLWGGCGGVVPFETLEACQSECNCN